LFQFGKLIANSGKGSIDIRGTAAGFYGINFVEPATNTSTGEKHLVLISDKASGDAVKITGTSSNDYGVVFNYNNPKEILATGGGNISISGTAGANVGVFLQNQDILATSGTITVNGGAQGIKIVGTGARFGSKAGTALTSSTSNVILSGDVLTFDALISGFTTSVNTTGALTLQPSGTSFTSALTFPIPNLSIANTVTGLTLGKTTNTQNITIGAATTIAGPVTVYGGDIAIDGNINTSSGNANGDVLIKATGAIVQNSAKSLTTNGGDVIYWADADGNNSGDIFFGATSSYTSPASIQTGGGHLWLGGGSGNTTWNNLSVGDGFAVGTADRLVGGSFTHNNGITIQATTINTAGGDIYMKGKGKAGNTTTSSNYIGGLYLLGSGSMVSGGGDITIEALSNTGSGNKYGLYNLGAYTFAPGSGDLTITGDASASSADNSGGNYTGRGIFLWRDMSPIVSSGNITMTGVKSSATGTHGIEKIGRAHV
jgi:hypothetical protein